MNTSQLEKHFGSAPDAYKTLTKLLGRDISQQLWSWWKYNGIDEDVQSTIQIKLDGALKAGAKVASAKRGKK